MTSLLVINARLLTVAAGAEDLGYLDEGWMLVEDGLIAATGSGQPPAGTTADETLDVAGSFVPASSRATPTCSRAACAGSASARPSTAGATRCSGSPRT